MTRFQKLTAITVATTFILVVIGVIVRSTDSGVACPSWPGCFPGQFLPGLDAGSNVWFEWIHRSVAFLIGILVLGVAVLALVDHRDRPSILWPSLASVAIALFQAYLGQETVRLGNSGPSVTAHLATAMILFAVLIYALTRSFYPARIGGRGSSQRFTLLAAFGTVATYALLLFGSNVTAGVVNSTLVFNDWPLMGGAFFPPLTDLTSAEVLHRWVAVIVGLIVVGIALVAWRTQRGHPVVLRLALLAAILYPLQGVVGGVQVLLNLQPWTQTVHLALGAAIWGVLAALVVASYYTARTTPAPGSGLAGAGTGAGLGSGGGSGDVPASIARSTGAPTSATTSVAHSRRDTMRAYLALTKPRIIELLLVTTVPAMFLAARGWPRMDLVWWTLLGGSLAAGSANAINCYLDRDIDELMTRTRRRPLPSHEVEPERAVVFGIVLGVIACAELAWFVNLVSAFLALLAIAFYVVVYTMILKRTTPQNIVIGGAAGALPPVIGWAAVTGDVGVPALILFALVFYWTPPHFWALSLRIRRDYAAAGVPMLPVVRGVPETTRQIGLYTIMLVAISLVLWAVARMGAIYLGAAVVLGAIFLWQAWKLWRVGTSAERSTAGAISLYKYSITYLSLLFLAIAVDALVVIPVG
ncbi:MAG TPA: heme o synthase [Candidatus Limnocylindrales bacterium]